MPHAQVNGTEIYFERHGDEGEPLVLVHGYTGDSGDWRFQRDDFAKTHRVLVMDNRGHGRSTAPTDRARYGITQVADDVEAVARQAGFERYHLVGHSLGGAVTQEVALRSPGRLMSLTLHDTSHTFDLSRSAIVQRYYEQRNKIAEEQGMAAVAALPWPLPEPPHMPPWRKAETDARMARMSVDAFIGAAEALRMWPGVIDRAHTITVPTLVIYGDLDMALVESAKWLANTIPGAQLVSVPEAGHSPQFERPELFNAALRAHLARNASSGGK